MSYQKDRLIRKWFNFEPDWPSGVNMHSDGYTIYSWHTAIAYHEQGIPTVWLNTTTYSGYTTRHQHSVWKFLRDKVDPNDIVVVHKLPFDVYGYQLKDYAINVNPQKRVDLQDVMRSASLKALQLGHELEPFETDSHSYNYGVRTRCKLCGHGARLEPVSLYTVPWSLHNRHFKMAGAAVRWHCNPRLQPIEETTLTDDEWIALAK